MAEGIIDDTWCILYRMFNNADDRSIYINE